MWISAHSCAVPDPRGFLLIPEWWRIPHVKPSCVSNLMWIFAHSCALGVPRGFCSFMRAHVDFCSFLRGLAFAAGRSRKLIEDSAHRINHPSPLPNSTTNNISFAKIAHSKDTRWGFHLSSNKIRESLCIYFIEFQEVTERLFLYHNLLDFLLKVVIIL